MKICWDNLEHLKLTKNGNFSINNHTYYYHESCKLCEDPYIGKLNQEYCSRECNYTSDDWRCKISNSTRGRTLSIEYRKRMSDYRKGKKKSIEHKQKLSDSHSGENHYMYGKHHSNAARKKISVATKGENNPAWKGGYGSNNIPMYDTYAPQLEPIEQCRRNTDDPNILEVKCTYCGKWYVPKRHNVVLRIAGLKSNDYNRFYCSKSCKQECPIFGQQKYYKGQKYYNSREVQPELRQLVFARDNWTCVKCSSTTSLHCHHIDPVANNPIESADMDNCITLCKACHKEAHEQNGCGYHELRDCMNFI